MYSFSAFITQYQLYHNIHSVTLRAWRIHGKDIKKWLSISTLP